MIVNPASVSAEGLPVALVGPFRLDHATIGQQVTERKPGVYALLSEHNTTGQLEYVGRADENLKERLEDLMNSFGWFLFAYADSPADAYDKERALYDHIQPPANGASPLAPTRP